MADGTVIDRLVVTLGIDPSGLEKGRQQAVAIQGKAVDDAKKSGKGIEDANKKASDSFKDVTKSALALFGVLVGAKDLGGFVASVVATDAAVGRLSGNLGISARNMQAWQAAAQRMGGSAEGMSSSISNASGQIVGLRTNGTALPPGVARLFASAGMSYDPNWTTQQYMIALAQASHKDVGSLGQQTVSNLLQASGFTSDFSNLAITHGGSGLQSYLNTMPTVSNGNIKNMQQTQSEWAAVQQTFTQVAATLVGDLGPAMKPFLDDLLRFGNLLKSAEPFLKSVADDIAKMTNEPGTRAALEVGGAVVAGATAVGALKWAGRFFTGGASTAAGDAATGVATDVGSGWLGGAIGGVLGRVAGPLGIWLGNTGPAGAGEGDVFRNRMRQLSGAPAGNNGAKGYWTPAIQAYVYNRLRNEAGLSDAGARGLLSRWMNVEAPAGPTSINPTSGAQGIAQWLGARTAGIAGDTSLKDQVSHVIGELNGSESRAGQALRSASTDAQGATGASMYERAAGYNRATGTDNFTAMTARGMASIGTLGSSAHSAIHVHASGSAVNAFHIGSLVVQTQSRDPEGMAKAAHGALSRAARVRAANYGQA